MDRSLGFFSKLTAVTPKTTRTLYFFRSLSLSLSLTISLVVFDKKQNLETVSVTSMNILYPSYLLLPIINST